VAATARPIDAITYAKQFVKNMPVNVSQLRLLQDVSNEMWMAAPWRWTLGTIAAATVAADTGDITVSGAPADLLHLVKVWVTDGGESSFYLDIESSLPASTTVKGTPSKVAWVTATGKYRIAPVYGSLKTGKTVEIYGWYKKTAPVLTQASINSAGTLLMDDEWFWVFQEGVLAKAYQFADDQRAGNVTVAEGRVQYTGQYARYQAGIDTMRASEPLLLVPPAMADNKTRG
jgi:hypothetical protein